MTGRLIGVVGPSGAGKDSVMQGLVALRPHFALVRRVITRAPELGGEDFEALSEARFAEMRDAGAFCVHWQAHGLSYGIPDAVRLRIGKGEQLLVNLSRDVLAQVARVFPAFTVLNVTASRATLEARLAARGRESEADIARRLGRAERALPTGLDLLTLANDGSLEDTVDAAIALLQPERV